MHLHAALPNLQNWPCQNTSCFEWPFALTSLQHQLWGNVFPPQPAGLAKLCFTWCNVESSRLLTPQLWSSCATVQLCQLPCHWLRLLGWAGFWACPQPRPSCSVLDNSKGL